MTAQVPAPRVSLAQRLWPLIRPTGVGLLASAVAVLGAALLIWSATIHLLLWSQSYQHIPTIGPLFLVQGIVGILIAISIVILRGPLVLAGGALFAVGTLGGLLLSVNVGLFGFQDSLSAPYATESLVVEAVAAGVLALGVIVQLLLGRRGRQLGPSLA